MPTHEVVNGLGLTYKGTIGISTATIPDVCKTPSPGGPVPIPYPNIATQSSLENGTTTVFAKGEMIAVKGSHYGRSNGDEAGTAGGIKSSVNMKATDWITYSFDVKFDGKNACRNTDKKFHNNQNAADLQGQLEPAVPLSVVQARGILCAVICECKAEAQAIKYETPVDPASFEEPDFGPGDPPGRAMNQACVERKLRQDYSNTNMHPEQSYDMSTNPPRPVAGRPTGSSRPDVVLSGGSSAAPLQAPNLAAVFEIKFPPDRPGAGQLPAYRRIAGNAPVIVLTPEDCGC